MMAGMPSMEEVMASIKGEEGAKSTEELLQQMPSNEQMKQMEAQLMKAVQRGASSAEDERSALGKDDAMASLLKSMPALGKEGAAGATDANELMRRLASDQGLEELDAQRQSLRSGGSSVERSEKLQALTSALGTLVARSSDQEKRETAFSRLASELGVQEGDNHARVAAVAALLLSGAERGPL